MVNFFKFHLKINVWKVKVARWSWRAFHSSRAAEEETLKQVCGGGTDEEATGVRNRLQTDLEVFDE